MPGYRHVVPSGQKVTFLYAEVDRRLPTSRRGSNPARRAASNGNDPPTDFRPTDVGPSHRR
jgi:hypothetical protein